MTRGAAVFTSVFLLAAQATAVSPVDPFDEMVALCAAGDAKAIPAGVSALKATEIDKDELDLMRFSQSMSYALAILHLDKPQDDIDKEKWQLPPEYFGWELGRARMLLTADWDGQGRMCSVTAPYDRFDAAVSAVDGLYGYGKPEKSYTYGESRLAAWKLKASGVMPEVLIINTDFGGERSPTTVQFILK